MTKLDLLADANPIVPDDDWGTTEEGRALFASIAEAAETAAMMPAARTRVLKPWVYVTVGFAVTIVAALPLLLRGGTDPEGVLLDETGFISADSLDGILDDNFVTRTEYEMALDATVQCVVDGGGEASWDYQEGDGVGLTIHAADSELLAQCEEQHLRSVQFVWAQQNEPPPSESFYFYASVVRCTEMRSGEDFGDLAQDSLGFTSTVGQRTINNALAEAPEIYDGCTADVTSQPLHYYFVLECVTGTTGTEFPSFTDTGSDRLTEDQIEILDGAREEFPNEFNLCMGEVTLD
jgi:hypothetical protein